MWNSVFRSRAAQRCRRASGTDEMVYSPSLGQLIGRVASQVDQACSGARVSRRLLTAADLLDKQPVDLTLFMDVGETLDSSGAKDRPLVQAWFTEIVVQFFTVVAVCCLAFAVGVIIGSIMCRTTLFSGAATDSLLGKNTDEPSVSLYLPRTGGWSTEPKIKAIFRGAFDVVLPEYCLGMTEDGSYVEALSAVLTLFYVPAQQIDKDARSVCFPGAHGGTVSLPPQARSPPGDQPFVSAAVRPWDGSAGSWSISPRPTDPLILSASSAFPASFGRWHAVEGRGLGVDDPGAGRRAVPTPERNSNIGAREGASLRDELPDFSDRSLPIRAIYSLSLLSRLGSLRGIPLRIESENAVTGTVESQSRMLLLHSASSAYPLGLMNFTAVQDASNTAVGPTLLFRNILPFVVGLTHGLNAVRVSVNLNVPLVDKDSKVIDVLKRDCDLGRTYFGLDVTIQAVRAMFFKHTQGSLNMLPFRVRCTSVYVAKETEWPLSPPKAFVDSIVDLATEYSTLNLVLGDR
ncbi:transmembrane protein [Cystoisospora suis]|uniref:Transmembrane protein n=1 Tax=Cystoisospora suis TaxID=483139 RepID=A0A2C6KKN9_9APIC|nr:transmembrane protein [Cystoisospora suis]